MNSQIKQSFRWKWFWKIYYIKAIVTPHGLLHFIGFWYKDDPSFNTIQWKMVTNLYAIIISILINNFFFFFNSYKVCDFTSGCWTLGSGCSLITMNVFTWLLSPKKQFTYCSPNIQYMDNSMWTTLLIRGEIMVWGCLLSVIQNEHLLNVFSVFSFVVIWWTILITDNCIPLKSVELFSLPNSVPVLIC